MAKPKADKPIPFSISMVPPVLDETKTVTRRPFRPARARVRVMSPVRSEMPLSCVEPMVPGRIYKAAINPLGAVSGYTRERKREVVDGAITGFSKTWSVCQLGLRPGEYEWVSPWGAVGDFMWVREHHEFRRSPWGTLVIYKADGSDRAVFPPEGWSFDRPNRPPMFLPRWASRARLLLEKLRVERLHDITEAEAILEGMKKRGAYWDGAPHPVKGVPMAYNTAREAFISIWAHIYGPEFWDANPWVWRLGFERVS